MRSPNSAEIELIPGRETFDATAHVLLREGIVLLATGIYLGVALCRQVDEGEREWQRPKAISVNETIPGLPV